MVDLGIKWWILFAHLKKADFHGDTFFSCQGDAGHIKFDNYCSITTVIASGRLFQLPSMKCEFIEDGDFLHDFNPRNNMKTKRV